LCLTTGVTIDLNELLFTLFLLVLKVSHITQFL
jgi:hypothetical protein